MTNVGKKYIIEFETVYGGHASVEGTDIQAVPDTLWRVKGFRSLVFDEEGLKKLVPLDQMRLSWWDEAYKKGLDEAWELARRLIRNTCPNDLMAMGFFDRPVQHREISQVLLLPYSEALAKLRDYEAKKAAEDEAIKVGDEVTCAITDFDGVEYNSRFVVCIIENDLAGGINFGPAGIDDVKDGWNWFSLDDLKKTGRHFPEIAVLLEKMKGGPNER